MSDATNDADLDCDLFRSSFSEVFWTEVVVVELVGFAIGFAFDWWFSFLGLTAEEEEILLEEAEAVGLVVEVVAEDVVGAAGLREE